MEGDEGDETDTSDEVDELDEPDEIEIVRAHSPDAVKTTIKGMAMDEVKDDSESEDEVERMLIHDDEW